MPDILPRLSEIVSQALCLATPVALTLGMKAEDIPGWDSAADIWVILAIEQAFGFRFITGELADERTVGDLVARIEGKLGQAA